MAATNPIVRAMFEEHIRLPGALQIIVTRIYAYTYLRDRCGFDPKARGFASIDYMVFAAKEVPEPLTDLTLPWVSGLLDRMAEDCQ